MLHYCSIQYKRELQILTRITVNRPFSQKDRENKPKRKFIQDFNPNKGRFRLFVKIRGYLYPRFRFTSTNNFFVFLKPLLADCLLCSNGESLTFSRYKLRIGTESTELKTVEHNIIWSEILCSWQNYTVILGMLKTVPLIFCCCLTSFAILLIHSSPTMPVIE